jgi:hypothetical protein
VIPPSYPLPLRLTHVLCRVGSALTACCALFDFVHSWGAPPPGGGGGGGVGGGGVVGGGGGGGGGNHPGGGCLFLATAPPPPPGGEVDHMLCQVG